MTINEMKAGIEKRYFEWLYELVCGKWEPRNLSFRRLLTFLYDTQFVPDNEMDRNRAVDGENLRGRFAEECNDIPGIIPENNVSVTFQGKPCNMLEMMVALALRCEETIMEDADIGNRTGQWFWSMIVSLGLASMDDNRFHQSRAEFVIERFRRRDYQPNGAGGLFTLQNPKEDMRTLDIWYQMMAYLNENDI
jgi:hypothetical protein